MHRIFVGGKGRKHVVANGAFKRTQVNVRSCPLNAINIIRALHLGQAGRSNGAD